MLAAAVYGCSTSAPSSAPSLLFRGASHDSPVSAAAATTITHSPLPFSSANSSSAAPVPPASALAAVAATAVAVTGEHAGRAVGESSLQRLAREAALLRFNLRERYRVLAAQVHAENSALASAICRMVGPGGIIMLPYVDVRAWQRGQQPRVRRHMQFMGLGAFSVILARSAALAGIQFEAPNEPFTSGGCPSCLSYSKHGSSRAFFCVDCYFAAHRDAAVGTTGITQRTMVLGWAAQWALNRLLAVGGEGA